LEDTNGREYLDFTSGIGVSVLGHAYPAIARSIGDAADGLIHTSNLFQTRPAIELAEELTRRSFASRVFFANSGTEANEGAVKFARLASGDAARRTIVYFGGSFHGRTLGMLSATDRADYREPFTPVAGGFRRANWNEAEALASIDETTAAAIVEPIQGEAGIRVPDASWFRALRERCDEVGALLIVDEVQCGLGRCGSLWAHETFGIVPDIMTLAKPLANGLPIGAVLLSEEAARAIVPGSHGTTFGGGPFVCTVALEVLKTVADSTFLHEVRRKGARLRRALSALASPFVAGVRGRGLFVGVRVFRMAEIREAAFEEGLLVVPAGENVLRFLSPLNVTDDEIDEAVVRFGRALRRAERSAS
jgi:predicted acetylornithine/succinylornithine family transaminase